jgi:hypothetical protein
MQFHLQLLFLTQLPHKLGSTCIIQRVTYRDCGNPQATYLVCLKSIEPLVGRNAFIDLEVQNPNPLQSTLLGNAHTSPSASAIVGNTSGTRLLEWLSAGSSHSACCLLLTPIGFLSAAFSAWELAKSHTEPCRGSREPYTISGSYTRWCYCHPDLTISCMVCWYY